MPMSLILGCGALGVSVLPPAGLWPLQVSVLCLLVLWGSVYHSQMFTGLALNPTRRKPIPFP